jgi:hypothetical protein
MHHKRLLYKETLTGASCWCSSRSSPVLSQTWAFRLAFVSLFISLLLRFALLFVLVRAVRDDVTLLAASCTATKKELRLAITTRFRHPASSHVWAFLYVIKFIYYYS